MRLPFLILYYKIQHRLSVTQITPLNCRECTSQSRIIGISFYYESEGGKTEVMDQSRISGRFFGVVVDTLQRLFEFPDSFSERAADFRKAAGAEQKQDNQQNDNHFKRTRHTHGRPPVGQSQADPAA